MPLRYPADRILVRCPNWVGDAVMATPTLRCLRRNYPQAHICLLLRPYVRHVLEHAPWFDRVVPWHGFAASLHALRGESYDLAVLLVHSFESALLVRLTRATQRVGYTRGDQRFLLTDPLPWPRDGGKRLAVAKVELYAGISRYLGCEGWEDKRQELFYSPEQAERVSQMLRAKGLAPERPLVAIVPGAAFGSSKYWAAERFAAAADALSEKLGATCIAIAAPDEAPIVAAVRQAMRAELFTFEPGEMDLGLLKPLVAGCSLMITTDTGPRHYAVALDVPVVVLMGPTNPLNTASDYAKTVILRHELPCAPCHKRICPSDHACMERIAVEDVLAACDELLRRFGPAIGWEARLLSRGVGP